MEFTTISIKRKNLPQFWEALKLDICTLVDVGAREGADPRWQLLGNHLRMIGFEPDPSESHRLNELVSNKGTTVLPDALYDNSQKITLNLCRSPGVSSCYKPNFGFLARFPDTERFDIMSELSLNARTLDEALEGRGPIDFLKMDTQGTESRIIAGGRGRMAEVFGLEIEAEFSQIYEGQPLFADVDSELRGLGFTLFDLRTAYWKRTKLPCRGVGQIIFGDAIYFRDPVASGVLPPNPPAALAICLLYGKFDYAMELAEFFAKSGAYTREEYARLATLLRGAASGSNLGKLKGVGSLTNLLQAIADRFREAQWARYEKWKF